MALERISVSLDQDLIAQFEQFLQDRGYRNRSEAVRDLIRDKLEAERTERSTDGHCIGTLSYVFNHHERELARRLTNAHHHHHHVAVSTLHVHLDHDNCLEAVVVKGPTRQVREFADGIIAQAGVRHGQLSLIPVEVADERHSHGNAAPEHTHIKPQT